ncbi:amidinotransferase [Desulforhopalus sp. IMCC35007]|nr:amidinotransferase [Desulforhopalus sp. IMCC35007]
MTGKIRSIVLKKPDDAFISQDHLNRAWQRFNYVQVPDYQKALEEFSVFEEIIRSHVGNILYLPQSESVGLDSIYTHDSLKVTNKGAVYFNTGKVLRQKESFESQKLLEAAGVPTLGRITSPGLMEGGDVVWLDERTVAIGLGYRTNMAGVEQFKEITRELIDDYVLVPMPHGDGEDQCLHLMSVISLVSDSLAVVYSRYMPVVFRRLLLDRGVRLIEVGDTEYQNLGSNVLALAPNICVIMEGNPLIKQALEDAGCQVHTYPGRNVSFYGTGGPTCLTCPVCRD